MSLSKSIASIRAFCKEHILFREKLDEDSVPWKNPIEAHPLYKIYRDKYPVTEGHLLFVPCFQDTSTIAYTTRKAVEYGRLMRRDEDWDGYNIGMNCGEAAGQTVWWTHIHLIPRRKGDVSNPIGGVRNTVPGKGDYKSPSYNKPIC